MLVQTIADSKQTIGLSGYLSSESKKNNEKSLFKEDFNLINLSGKTAKYYKIAHITKKNCKIL
jgi:hypothetical protein